MAIKTRPDARKLMQEIADVYKNNLELVQKYWNDSKPKTVIENGIERELAAIPPEKIQDTIKDFQSKAFQKVESLIEKWNDEESEYFALHGEDLTPDKDLLNDVVNPSLEQLKELASRYFGKNNTMEQSIINFAKGKDKYKAIMELPRTQTHAERKEIIDLYDKRILRPVYINSTQTPEKDYSAFYYTNCYIPIVDKWQSKVV